MEWSDKTIVLGQKRYGETDVILEVLTRDHGRHKGVVKGGTGRRMRPALQAGNELDVAWRARLSEHLGTFQIIDLAKSRAADLMASPIKLAVATAACAVTSLTVPEREPHAPVFDGLSALIDGLNGNDEHPEAWAAAYIAWEAQLLRELGFGLDLTKCAVTGETKGLTYVSPRTGRAVTASAAGVYKEKLLPLPGFLAGKAGASASPEDLRQGFALTGSFLDRHILAPHGHTLPPARARLMDRFQV